MEDAYYLHISELSQGDLGRIMERYSEDVWQYAYLITKKRDMADDITQEVFIKVYRSIDSFRGESSLKTWLLQITKHTSISLMKRAYFKYHVLTHSFKNSGESPSAELIVIQNEFTNEIWKMVMTLSCKYREILTLSVHYELSTSEIAQMLQVSVNTVKSRMHRARKQLQKKLKGELAWLD